MCVLLECGYVYVLDCTYVYMVGLWMKYACVVGLWLCVCVCGWTVIMCVFWTVLTCVYVCGWSLDEICVNVRNLRIRKDIGVWDLMDVCARYMESEKHV
jgi:hypothetical protein